MADLAELLRTLREHYRLSAEQPPKAVLLARAKAVKDALDILTADDNSQWFGRLAWGVLGSKAAAATFLAAVKDLAAEATYQTKRKGRASSVGKAGDGGRPQDLIRRWFAVRVQSAFRAHGLPSGRTRGRDLEHTLAVLLDLAERPSSEPLRLLRTPKAR